MPCYSLGVTRYRVFKVGRRYRGFFCEISGLEERPKKLYTIRSLLVTWEAKHRYQGKLGYAVKNRRIGAAEIIKLSHPPKKKNGKQSEKRNKNREERNRTHPSEVLLLRM